MIIGRAGNPWNTSESPSAFLSVHPSRTPCCAIPTRCFPLRPCNSAGYPLGLRSARVQGHDQVVLVRIRPWISRFRRPSMAGSGHATARPGLVHWHDRVIDTVASRGPSPAAHAVCSLASAEFRSKTFYWLTRRARRIILARVHSFLLFAKLAIGLPRHFAPPGLIFTPLAVLSSILSVSSRSLCAFVLWRFSPIVTTTDTISFTIAPSRKHGSQRYTFCPVHTTSSSS